ncbi:hypothetical protein NFI96_004291 [Prochilodus magdalenae]|nr:hypothetical protein NFI96_004291 [Prochilodus magdalenae]
MNKQSTPKAPDCPRFSSLSWGLNYCDPQLPYQLPLYKGGATVFVWWGLILLTPQVLLIGLISLGHSGFGRTPLNISTPDDHHVKTISAELISVCCICGLCLSSCSIAEEGCAALVSALNSNPSHLRELNLGTNNPGESGVKLLSDLLEDPHCKLEKLHVFNCSITEEGCAALVSALKSNPSHLRELNLNSNDPGESGVKLLSDLLEDPHCKLEKLHAVVLFLNTVERANDLVQTSIVLQDQLTPVHPLSTPAKKVILSNIPPFIKDEHLTRECFRFRKLVSPIRKIPLGCKSPLVRHLVSFRKVVYMVLKDGADAMDVTFKLRVDGFDYSVFVSSDTDIRCFGCGLLVHLVLTCPARRNEAGASEGAGDPEPEAAEPATEVQRPDTVWDVHGGELQ